MTTQNTPSANPLDARIMELAARDRDLAVEILSEVIRIPADYVDKSEKEGGDPSCGLSNHEGPRLEYLKRKIVEIKAVAKAEDVFFDEFGNLVWQIEDEQDGIPRDEKKVIYLDGHSDTVKALRAQWRQKTGGGLDSYDGLVDATKVDKTFLRGELGHLPPEGEWEHLVFGRGSADQLSGVVSEALATRILLELQSEGALKGCIVRAYATAAEEDNDGGGPKYVVEKVWPGAPAHLIPDAIILTEGTGDANKGALGMYRGQRGRMQIEVEVIGRSCHGSMPWEGKNPLEYGAAIVVEAARAYEARDGFLDDPFLGHGTRTASWSQLDTPSDCAVPERFVFRFDRRLTVGESAKQAVADIEKLAAVNHAREAGLQVKISVPTYDQLTHKGYKPGNPQIYPGWATPEDHPAIQAAVTAYTAVVTPGIPESTPAEKGNLRRAPRVDRWIFSTDGVGFPIPKDDTSVKVPASKRWIQSGDVKHPPMFGLGPGIEQNTHKIGECVDARELERAIAFIVRFPSAFRSL